MTHDERRLRRQKVKAAIAEGKLIDEIAEEYGLRREYVSRLVPHYKRVPFRTIKVLADLLNTKLTVRELAIKYKVSKQRIAQILKEAKDAGIVFYIREANLLTQDILIGLEYELRTWQQTSTQSSKVEKFG